ncbi:hypothetical protein WJX72_005282 [[Myrmecia] bisecta]|uniref:Myb-like domain-containing protein n=1 Tax=[Myrmecia] bisecta TaxID=41462 RepID=A0AAW1P9Q4_9CHLO
MNGVPGSHQKQPAPDLAPVHTNTFASSRCAEPATHGPANNASTQHEAGASPPEPGAAQPAGGPTRNLGQKWTEEEEGELVRLVVDDDHRERMLGEGIAHNDWPALAVHFGRVREGRCPGNGVRHKYWTLEHGDAGDGAEGGKTRRRHYTKTPYKLLIVTALERLPGQVGTVKEILDTIAATPAYKSDLDWSVHKGSKTYPKWHVNCSRQLGRHPKLFERAGQRKRKRGAMPLWKLRQEKLVEQRKHKLSTKTAMPFLGKKHG